MRIGILTFHCAHNYGAVLQCYALQSYLEKKGHEVGVIDYRPTAITNVYKWFYIKQIIRKNLYKAFKAFFLMIRKKRRYDSFERFITKNLRLEPVESIMENPYDLILIGSDQVWNYHLTNGFDNYYWGNFLHPTKTRIASYAASMHDSWTDEEAQQIARSLNNFSVISVRENILANKLKHLIGDKEIFQVVDPTLLLNRNDWDEIAAPPRIDYPYLLLFQVEGRNERTEAFAAEIAKQKNLKIVRLYTLYTRDTTTEIASCSPNDFITLFKFASFVVCSSFHGTVFSLQFGKPFLSVRMRNGKDNRVESLLSSFGLLNRFVDSIDDFDSQTDKLGNYSIEEISCNSKMILKNFICNESHNN